MAIKKTVYTLVCDRCGKTVETENEFQFKEVHSKIRNRQGNNCVDEVDAELCEDCYMHMKMLYEDFWRLNEKKGR